MHLFVHIDNRFWSIVQLLIALDFARFLLMIVKKKQLTIFVCSGVNLSSLGLVWQECNILLIVKCKCVGKSSHHSGWGDKMQHFWVHCLSSLKQKGGKKTYRRPHYNKETTISLQIISQMMSAKDPNKSTRTHQMTCHILCVW